LVFVTPPWPEIYVGDEDRQHDLQEAVNEYERLLVAFSSLGYDIQVLPKVGVGCRADLVIQRLGLL
jgi:predicted ATPase